MSWNYRIVRRKTRFGDYLSLHEVYYDEEGKPDGITVDSCELSGFETPLDLMGTLIMMVRDVWRSRHNILDYKDFYNE